jgi:hypothetical protein
MPTYILRVGESGPVKIGKAEDVEGRMAALQTAHHEPLNLLRIVDTHFDTEAAFHERFAAQRIRGEWFTFVAEMLTFVPTEPAPAPALKDIIRVARLKAAEDMRAMLHGLYARTDKFETRRQFISRTARQLGFHESRVKKLFYGERSRVEVAELEGVRALIAKLGFEEPKTERATAAFARIDRPLPLFPNDSGEGR